MLKIFKKILGLEKRRYYRYPCNIRAHFSFIFKSVVIRGEGIITDITRHGICCDDVRFFHSEPDFKLKLNSVITVYFSLPKEYSGLINLELKGKIRSILHKGDFGYIKRFGIMFNHITRVNSKALYCFVKDIEKSHKGKSN